MNNFERTEKIKQNLEESARMLAEMQQYSLANDVWSSRNRMNSMTVSDISNNAYLAWESNEIYEGDTLNEGGGKE
jgi:hypothetical protein